MRVIRMVAIISVFFFVIVFFGACSNQAETEDMLHTIHTVYRLNINGEFRADVVAYDYTGALMDRVSASTWISRILTEEIDVTQVEFFFHPTKSTLLMLEELNIVIEEEIANNHMGITEDDFLKLTESDIVFYGLTAPITVEDLIYENTLTVNEIYFRVLTQSLRDRIWYAGR